MFEINRAAMCFLLAQGTIILAYGLFANFESFAKTVVSSDDIIVAKEANIA